MQYVFSVLVRTYTGHIISQFNYLDTSFGPDTSPDLRWLTRFVYLDHFFFSPGIFTGHYPIYICPRAGSVFFCFFKSHGSDQVRSRGSREDFRDLTGRVASSFFSQPDPTLPDLTCYGCDPTHEQPCFFLCVVVWISCDTGLAWTWLCRIWSSMRCGAFAESRNEKHRICIIDDLFDLLDLLDL